MERSDREELYKKIIEIARKQKVVIITATQPQRIVSPIISSSEALFHPMVVMDHISKIKE